MAKLPLKSQPWTVNQEDIKRVVRNALIFLAPVAITLLLMVQGGDANLDHYKYTFEMWAVGVALDFFRKLQA